MGADLRHSIELVLGRPEGVISPDEAFALYATERVLVTGAGGSIGTELCRELGDRGIDHLATDVVTGYARLDVRDPDHVAAVCLSYQPTVIFHMAGAKHAPEGEDDPWRVTRVNTLGTMHILNACRNTRIVVASTCKAADPETAYGASKLIAERLALNAEQRVARFYNVVDSQLNAFRLWEQLDKLGEPIPYTPCRRFLMSMREAVALTAWSAMLPTGRYTIDPGACQPMVRVAQRLYPTAELYEIPPRRGDRIVEPVKAASERFAKAIDGIYRIHGPHDPR
jgi:FlaA1/EpsC-like NDP-sugar epimerase